MSNYLNKNLVVNFLIILSIFGLDRITKEYVIFLDQQNFNSNIFSSSFVNIELIWNYGIAFGLFSTVSCVLGSDFIVQCLMSVVVGGVGNIWGTLAGATMIGLLQKGIEWFNPSNTLAAQTYMVVFIILFIQFRPKGIIALKGRAAEF